MERLKASPQFQIATYLFLTFTLSWTQQYFIIHNGGVQNHVRTFLHMWTPGIVGLFCSWFFDGHLKSLALRRPQIHSMALAYFLPIIATFLIIFFLTAFSMAKWQIKPQLVEAKGGLVPALVAIFILAPTLGMILPFISGLGEEIGWRGYLHTKMGERTLLKKSFLTGVIWSVWHWPLMLFGDYSNSDLPWVNVICFSLGTICISYFMASTRERSGSVFPAGLLHGAHNLWILGITPGLIRPGPLFPYFGGESGVFGALAYAILFLIALVKPFRIRS